MMFSAVRHLHVAGPGAVEPADVAELLDWADAADLLDWADAVPMKGSDLWHLRYSVIDRLPGLQQFLEKSAFHPECLQ
jgi:hypothetical protein